VDEGVTDWKPKDQPFAFCGFATACFSLNRVSNIN